MSWMATTTRKPPTATPSHAHIDMAPAYQPGSVAGPGSDATGVHVDKAALEIEADTAELLRLRPGLELHGRDRRDEEVDRVAVRVLAVARDLVALLAQHQVVLRMPEPGDDIDDVAMEV